MSVFFQRLGSISQCTSFYFVHFSNVLIKERDAIENDLKVARQHRAELEKTVAAVMNQHSLMRMHDMRHKVTLNLSKTDGQIRPYAWKRRYMEPTECDSTFIDGAEGIVQNFMKARRRKTTLEIQRIKANSNLKQATKQSCASVTQCQTLKVGQHKIVIIPQDVRRHQIRNNDTLAVVCSAAALTVLIFTALLKQGFNVINESYYMYIFHTEIIGADGNKVYTKSSFE